MLTLYKARSIITMNEWLPRATAVLVRDGMIAEVGEPEHMEPWLRHEEYVVEDQLAEKVIAGFIDPHLPEYGGGVIANGIHHRYALEIPWGEVEPVTDAEGFDRRMGALSAKKSVDEPLFIWGYHQLAWPHESCAY